MKHEVHINVFNRKLNLMTDEPIEYTEKLALALNDKMAKLIKQTSSLSVADAVALISLDNYDSLCKARKSIENIRSQIKGYVDEAEEARLRAETAELEAEDLRKQVAQLEREIALRKSFTPEATALTAKDILSQDISNALESRFPYNYNK